jgi:hypothetical protein
MVDRLHRLAPLAGVVAAVGWLAGILVLQSGNPADPDPAAIATYFREERTTILVGGLIVGLGTFFFFWFLGSLPRGGGDVPDWLARVALVSGTAGATMMLALTGPHTTGATSDVELLGEQTSVALWRLSHTFFVAAEVAFAVFVAALALLAFAGGGLPRWLGWTGLALALVLLIIPIAWLALIVLLPLWLIALAISLYRRPAAPTAT